MKNSWPIMQNTAKMSNEMNELKNLVSFGVYIKAVIRILSCVDHATELLKEVLFKLVGIPEEIHDELGKRGKTQYHSIF